MPILAYGEDALTFHAVSVGLPGLLRQLDDDCDPSQAIVFYRPSFGRRGSRPGEPPRSEFGEFDAVIGTPRAVYLVETKWSASGEFRGTDIKLRGAQCRRHKEFRAYVQEWRRRPPTDWSSFISRMRPILSDQFENLVPPGARSRLARNLFYILNCLDACGPNVIDVLLFVRLSDLKPLPASCDGFRVVEYLCKPETNSNFVLLAK